MNSKGQVAALALMLGIVVIILALAWAKPVNQIVVSSMSDNATEIYGDNAEAGHGLDCNNSSISSFQKAGCWVADIGQFYFIGSIMAIAGIVAAAKFAFGGAA